MSEVAFDEADLPEISMYAADCIESWRRTLAAADGDRISLFERAAIELQRVAEREETPAGRQAVIDEIYAMAITAGIDDDDAVQRIIVDGADAPPDARPGASLLREANGNSFESSGPRDDIPPATSLDDFGAGHESATTRFELEMLDDIAIADDPAELVEGLLPMGPALGVVFGPPKSLKSFLLTHVGMHIAANRPYCGRAVQGGAFVYVTSEGIRGVRRRLIAARRAMGLEGKQLPFALVSTMPNLGAGQSDREALQAAIARKLPGLNVPLRGVVIDTMRRAMPGRSENEQKDVSVLVDNCEALARAFGCLVLLVHHSPRSDDQRGSGSNALDGAADLMWSVIRPDETRRSATAAVVRFKDGEEGDAWTFELRPAEVGTDRDGTPITSCFVEVTIEPERKSTPAKTARLSDAQQRVFDILLTAITEAGQPGLAGGAAPARTRAITREMLKRYAVAAGWWEADKEKSSRSRLAARLNEMAGKHMVGLTAEHVWLAGRTL
jgi:hypothetical protein